MAFLRNAWYCAAWSEEIGRVPLGRVILGEKLAFFRLEGGGVGAIGDVCPHHLAPLSAGKIVGDSLRCPYHGIAFGADGSCTRNPHGPTTIAALRVDSYPVVERYGMAWVWMGDAAGADPARIPLLPGHDDPGFSVIRGLIPISGHYELVSDNLLDLTHNMYLHPFLEREYDADARIIREVRQDGDTLVTRDDSYNVPRFAYSQFLWPDSPDRIEIRAGVRWEAPANMVLKIFFGDREHPEKLKTWGAELVTPETDRSCHYFWTTARDFRRDDAEFSRELQAATQRIFATEDGWVIDQVQRNMGSRTDFLDMQPVLLRTDEFLVRARRLLAKRLAAES